MNGPVISLHGLRGLALIVKRSSGVLYTNQTGGNCCMHPVEEGVLVPLEEHCDIEAKLAAFFERRGGILEHSDADELEVILRTPEPPYCITPTFFLDVDRDRLRDSMEAWLYVVVKACPDEHLIGYAQDGNGDLSRIRTLSGRQWNPSQQPELGQNTLLYPLSGFGRASAVLTWENSD